MNICKAIFICMLFFLCINLSAQDVHFSSFMAGDMYLNPAKTAFFSSDFKVGAAYRNQWQTVSGRGYNTTLITSEAKLFSSSRYKHSFGLGCGFLKDVAGSLGFGQRQLLLSMAYNKMLTKRNNHFIAVGINMQNTSWSYDVEKADFGLSPSDKEGIYLSKTTAFDIGVGIHWQISLKEDKHISAGFAVAHLNSPVYSFYDNSNIRLARRYTAYLTYLFTTSQQSFVNFAARYSYQNDNMEILAGGEFIYDLSMTMFDNEYIAVGLYFRTFDALVLSLRYQHSAFNIGLSYDVNLSSLSKVSYTYGALELWTSYEIDTFKHKKQIKTIPCPTF